MKAAVSPSAAPRADEVPSPCVDVCELDAVNICRGCGRSLDEIAEWSAASGQRRQQINRAAAIRRRIAQAQE